MNSNWFAENKFLTGFVAIVIAAAGGLGFLILKGAGRFGEVSLQFDQQAAELRRLSELALYPNAENENRLKEQQAAYRAAIDDLMARLKTQQPEVAETSPDEFKAKLALERDGLAQKAGASVKIPENYFLGFEDYENNLPPDAKTATLLLQQLKAVSAVLGKLVEAGVIEIKGVRRQAVPGESIVTAGGGPRERKEPGQRERESAPMIVRYPFEVSFVADQSRLRTALNSLASLPDFLIVRAINIDNSKKTGPPRGAAPGETAPVSGKPAEAKKLEFIVGMEKVEATLRIELLAFKSEGGEGR